MRSGALLLLALLSSRAPASAQAKALEGFDGYVARSMAAWKVPGLAIAIVRNDSVVLAKGYGVRTVGKPDKVDARTLFAIGSSSKAMLFPESTHAPPVRYPMTRGAHAPRSPTAGEQGAHAPRSPETPRSPGRSNSNVWSSVNRSASGSYTRRSAVSFHPSIVYSW